VLRCKSSKPRKRKPFNQNDWLRLRAPRHLVECIEQHTRERGESLSAWVRGAVESRLVDEGASHRHSPR
jgi:hypothetical protein